eukprot:gnl/Dysnectes_brevis/5357_a7667_247.p1 GENE.gnl/Dysnectes_brevis/5357_a7667_247~~gnl/Dysnectes_brevis/5357_a7667_247.p1  ORF type:complete len:1307 (-),score=319.94 gnl/Dysnectes_brevis/5357_a7667_247:101-4021(-)
MQPNCSLTKRATLKKKSFNTTLEHTQQLQRTQLRLQADREFSNKQQMRRYRRRQKLIDDSAATTRNDIYAFEKSLSRTQTLAPMSAPGAPLEETVKAPPSVLPVITSQQDLPEESKRYIQTIRDRKVKQQHELTIKVRARARLKAQTALVAPPPSAPHPSLPVDEPIPPHTPGSSPDPLPSPREHRALLEARRKGLGDELRYLRERIGMEGEDTLTRGTTRTGIKRSQRTQHARLLAENAAAHRLAVQEACVEHVADLVELAVTTSVWRDSEVPLSPGDILENNPHSLPGIAGPRWRLLRSRWTTLVPPDLEGAREAAVAEANAAEEAARRNADEPRELDGLEAVVAGLSLFDAFERLDSIVDGTSLGSKETPLFVDSTVSIHELVDQLDMQQSELLKSLIAAREEAEAVRAAIPAEPEPKKGKKSSKAEVVETPPLPPLPSAIPPCPLTSEDCQQVNDRLEAVEDQWEEAVTPLLIQYHHLIRRASLHWLHLRQAGVGALSRPSDAPELYGAFRGGWESVPDVLRRRSDNKLEFDASVTQLCDALESVRSSWMQDAAAHLEGLEEEAASSIDQLPGQEGCESTSGYAEQTAAAISDVLGDLAWAGLERFKGQLRAALSLYSAQIQDCSVEEMEDWNLLLADTTSPGDRVKPSAIFSRDFSFTMSRPQSRLSADTTRVTSALSRPQSRADAASRPVSALSHVMTAGGGGGGGDTASVASASIHTGGPASAAGAAASRGCPVIVALQEVLRSVISGGELAIQASNRLYEQISEHIAPEEEEGDAAGGEEEDIEQLTPLDSDALAAGNGKEQCRAPIPSSKTTGRKSHPTVSPIPEEGPDQATLPTPPHTEPPPHPVVLDDLGSLMTRCRDSWHTWTAWISEGGRNACKRAEEAGPACAARLQAFLELQMRHWASEERALIVQCRDAAMSGMPPPEAPSLHSPLKELELERTSLQDGAALVARWDVPMPDPCSMIEGMNEREALCVVAQRLRAAPASAATPFVVTPEVFGNTCGAVFKDTTRLAGEAAAWRSIGVSLSLVQMPEIAHDSKSKKKDATPPSPEAWFVPWARLLVSWLLPRPLTVAEHNGLVKDLTECETTEDFLNRKTGPFMSLVSTHSGVDGPEEGDASKADLLVVNRHLKQVLIDMFFSNGALSVQHDACLELLIAISGDSLESSPEKVLQAMDAFCEPIDESSVEGNVQPSSSSKDSPPTEESGEMIDPITSAISLFPPSRMLVLSGLIPRIQPSSAVRGLNLHDLGRLLLSPPDDPSLPVVDEEEHHTSARGKKPPKGKSGRVSRTKSSARAKKK